MDTPFVITMCNASDPPHPNTENYKKTLETNGWNYVILGRGTEWTGFAGRLRLYHSEISKMDPEQLIVVTDARDVLCIAPPKNFRQAFNRFGKDLLVSMELFAEGFMTYYPDKEYGQVTYLDKYFAHYKIDITNIVRKYVNAGLIAGKAKDVLKLYEWSTENHFTDDQKALGAYMNAFPERVAADFDAAVLHTSVAFLNGSVNNKYQKLDSPTFRQLLGLESFFLHIPGLAISKGQHFAYTSISDFVVTSWNRKRLCDIYPEYSFESLKFQEYMKFE